MNIPQWNWPVIGAVALLASMASVAAWWKMTPSLANVGQTTVAKEDSRVDEMPKEVIQPKKGLEVLIPAAKGKLNLPADIQSDPKKHVVGSVIIKPNPRPQAVIPVYDEGTGKTEIETQRMEYPLIDPEQTGEARISYGIKNGGVKVWRLTGHEDIVQVKGVNLGADAALDTTGSFFVGVGAAMKW